MYVNNKMIFISEYISNFSKPSPAQIDQTKVGKNQNILRK